MIARASGRSLALRQVVAIAVNTFKEAVRSRVFYILLAFAICLVVFSSAMGLMAVGSLYRVILDMGLSTMTLFSAMTAIFVGIGLVYQEIERKTIYNILSKPVSRAHFLIGRYCGLLAVLFVNLLVMVLALSLVLLAVGGFTWRIFAAEGYTFLELMILTAVAIFFSSLTSPVVSALCTGAFFIIGHTSAAIPQLLVPEVESAAGRRALLTLYHVLPDLSLLSINNLVVHELPEAPGFALRAVLYTVLVVTALLILSALFFRRRDMV